MITVKAAFIAIAVIGLISDAVALYFAFHSRRHERENADTLARIEGMLIGKVGDDCDCCEESFPIGSLIEYEDLFLCQFCVDHRVRDEVERRKEMN